MRARKEAADAQMTALIEAEEAKKASRDQCRVLHSSCTQLDPYRAALSQWRRAAFQVLQAEDTGAALK